MATSNPADEILMAKRSGTYPDSYVELTESKKIINNIVVLTELPYQRNHIKIPGYYEIYKTPIESNQFICNYAAKTLTFNPSENGKTVDISYMGMGYIQIPASFVYAHDVNNPDVLQNLQEIIDNEQTSIDVANNLSQKVTETNNAIANINDVTQRLSVFEVFDNAHTYYALNRVQYNGSTYECIQTSTGNLPTNPTYFKMVAQAGLVQSVNGKSSATITLNAGDVGAVSSVNGKTGTAVTLNSDDVGALSKTNYDPDGDGSVEKADHAIAADNAAKIENQSLNDLDARYLSSTGGTLTGDFKVKKVDGYISSESPTDSAKIAMHFASGNGYLHLFDSALNVVNAMEMSPNGTVDFPYIAKSLGSNGYVKLPVGGLILQWGSTTVTTAGIGQNVNLPIAFPNNNLFATGGSASVSSSGGAGVVDKSRIFVWSSNNGAVISWFAIGN